jgi:hypothetical protein
MLFITIPNDVVVGVQGRGAGRREPAAADAKCGGPRLKVSTTHHSSLVFCFKTVGNAF